MPQSQKPKQKQYCNKFSKEFKNGPHLSLSLSLSLGYVYIHRKRKQRQINKHTVYSYNGILRLTHDTG